MPFDQQFFSRTNVQMAVKVDGCLSLENVCLFGSEKICHDEADVAGNEAVSSFENEEFADSTILVVDSSREEHYYDFHIVYNSSYKVLMLYFHGYSCDGQPLQFNEIEKDLPSSSAKEHPYLNRPCYTLHPCGTSEVMRLLFQDSALGANIIVEGERYLISWLSVVGQCPAIVEVRSWIETRADHPSAATEFSLKSFIRSNDGKQSSPVKRYQFCKFKVQSHFHR
ncbi:Ubiquitin-like-conjugating enzyme ATG10-like protein [Drosera capensis]